MMTPVSKTSLAYYSAFPDPLDSKAAKQKSSEFVTQRYKHTTSVKAACKSAVRMFTSIGEVPGMTLGYLVGSGARCHCRGL